MSKIYIDDDLDPNIEVINKYHYNGKPFPKPTYYCGRGSPLGNNFIIGKHGDRDEVIALDEEAFWKAVMHGALTSQQVDYLDRIYTDYKRGKVHLQCFCAPRACHCDKFHQVFKHYDKPYFNHALIIEEIEDNDG